MSRSYINFFWTGKQPSKALLTHLQDWQNHLIQQGSEFQVRLWLTDDLYQTISNTQSASAIQIQNADPLLKQAEKNYPNLFAFYQLLLENRLYSFCSSFVRMLILDQEPGFYCDVDIALRKTERFPISLDAIIAMAGDALMETSNPVFAYHNGKTIENQIMLTLKPKAFFERLKDNDVMPEKAQKLLNYYHSRRTVLENIIKADPFLRNHPILLTEYFLKTNRKNLLFELGHNVADTIEKQQQDNVLGRALLLFQKFFRLSIAKAVTAMKDEKWGCDALRAQRHSIAELIQQHFSNPEQDNSNVYAWSHPIHFHLKKIERQTQPLYEFFHRTRSHKQRAFNMLISLYAAKEFDKAENHLALFLKKWKVVTLAQLLQIIHRLPDHSKSNPIIDFLHQALRNHCLLIPSHLFLDSPTQTAKEKIHMVATHLLERKKQLDEEEVIIGQDAFNEHQLLRAIAHDLSALVAVTEPPEDPMQASHYAYR